MAKKYEAVVKGLEVLPVQGGQKYQERLDKIKEKIVERDPVALSVLYLKHREERDKLEEQRSELDAKLAACEQLMQEAFEASGVDTIKLSEGRGTVRMDPEPYAVVESQEVYRQWCIEHGMLEKMAIAWQTTNSLVKSRLLDGEDLPPGVKAFFKPKFVRTA